MLSALRNIDKPMLLREIAPMLDPTSDGADAKDKEKGTPLDSRIRRLTRLIGSTKSPGVLAPFILPRKGGRTDRYWLVPIPPGGGDGLLTPEYEPSDPPAS